MYQTYFYTTKSEKIYKKIETIAKFAKDFRNEKAHGYCIYLVWDNYCEIWIMLTQDNEINGRHDGAPTV